MELKFFDTEDFKQGLEFSSVSDIAAKQRMSVYHDALSNLETLREINMKLRHFDDLNAVENMAPSAMGVALAEATLKAQINSIVGYVAIERSMSQMTQMLVYRDVITKAGASIMPMIGPDNPRERANKVYQANLQAGTEFTMTFDALVPGSLAITVKIGDKTYQMMDDRQGNIMTQPGVLTAGTVNYETGAVNMTFASAVAATDTIKICYQLNKELGQGNNRTTIKQGYFQIKAAINKYEFETDLITAMISQKTVGGDVVAELQQSVTDERILAINNKLVNTLKENYVGTTLTIDLSAFSIESGFTSSMLQLLNMGLAAVDNAIAARCYKAVAATAYIVGNGAATMFQSLEDAQGWVANNSGYVNDVIGFYKGRAVIRNLNLDPYECYGVVKTPDGQLASLGFGLLLPATNLPLTGNFANTNEVASGLYDVSGVAPVAMALAQRFVIEMPANFMVVA
jgi:hypothetical protein